MVFGLIPRHSHARVSAAQATGLLLAVVACGFAGALGMDFVYDDYRVITGDPRAQYWTAWAADVPTGIRPLLKLSYLLNWRSGFGPTGYLFTNLVLHLGNTLLLWRIGRELLPRLVPGHASIAGPASWLAALLFALHPVQAEAVTYFSGRSLPLMSFFLLSALLLWLRRPGQTTSDAVALGCFIMALAARETAVVFPALMVLVLWLSPARSPEAWRLPAMSTAVVGLAGLVLVAGHPGYQAFFAGAFAHGDTPANLPDAARGLHYLSGRFLGLQPGSIDPVLTDGAPAWLPLLAASVLAWLAIDPNRRRRHAWLVFGLAWYFLQLLPMYSIVPRAEPANDRHLYLAAWGPMLSLACGLCWFGRNRGWQRRLATVAASLLLLASMQGLDARNRILGDEQAVWEEVIARSPGHARAWHNLGVALHRKGQLPLARDAYCRALDLHENELGRRALRVLARQGQPGCKGSEDSPGPAL